MKRGTPGHPKMQDLADRLNIRIYAATGIMEMIWHYAGTYSPRGDIGRVSDKVLAKAVDWDREPVELINALVESGWLDRNDQHRLVIHDWAEHAEATVARKLQRNKEFFLEACGSRTDTDASVDGQQQASYEAKARLGKEPVVVVSGESAERGDSPAAPSDDAELQPAEFLAVRRIWERAIGKLKASERKLLEERMGEVSMPEDEWEERIYAYKSSGWGEKNGHPLRGFLKDPQGWEDRTTPSTALVVVGPPIRELVAARPVTQRYFYAFPKNRRELTDADMEAAWPTLQTLSDEQVEAAAGHAERNFPTWNNVPSPVNHLAKKPWTAIWMETANPPPKEPSARRNGRSPASEAAREMYYRDHPNERPSV